MSLVVELFGGPGIGKTTFAAKLFAAIKDDQRFTVELVQEYVKTWAWEKRDIGTAEQIYLSAKQLRNESRLYDKVDIIITDAPVLLGSFYARKYVSGSMSNMLCDMYAEIEDLADRFRIVLKRVKPYDARGRFQDEQTACNFDVDIADFLEGWSSINVPASTEETVKLVLARATELSSK